MIIFGFFIQFLQGIGQNMKEKKSSEQFKWVCSAKFICNDFPMKRGPQKPSAFNLRMGWLTLVYNTKHDINLKWRWDNKGLNKNEFNLEIKRCGEPNQNIWNSSWLENPLCVITDWMQQHVRWVNTEYIISLSNTNLEHSLLWDLEWLIINNSHEA